MLNLARDTTGDVNLRMNGNTRLTNLTVVVDPTSIHSCTAATYLTMEYLGQLEQLLETFLRTNAITTSYHDGRTLQVVLGSLYMVVEHLHDVCLRAYILRYLRINHLLLAVTLVECLLHHATTNGSHLGAMVGVHDRCHDVTTKGRTNLIEQVVIVLATLVIVERTDLELCTVGSQTRGQR